MKIRFAAFTLIELMVVISIVVVLVGISMPVLGKILVTSRNLQCQNNLHQIGMAMISHAGEHDGYLPTASGVVPYRTTDAATKLPGWTEQLEPYLGTDRKIFTCPSSRTLLPANAQYGYFMGSHAAYVDSGNQYTPVRLGRLVVPSKYFIAGDVVANTVFTDRAALDADKNDDTKNPGFATMVKPFHNRKTTLVFADGHVGTFSKFDPTLMTVRYGLRDDGNGYNYSD